MHTEGDFASELFVFGHICVERMDGYFVYNEGGKLCSAGWWLFLYDANSRGNPAFDASRTIGETELQLSMPCHVQSSSMLHGYHARARTGGLSLNCCSDTSLKNCIREHGLKLAPYFGTRLHPPFRRIERSTYGIGYCS